MRLRQKKATRYYLTRQPPFLLLFWNLAISIQFVRSLGVNNLMSINDQLWYSEVSIAHSETKSR